VSPNNGREGYTKFGEEGLRTRASVAVTLASRVTWARVAFTDKESMKHVVRWSVAGDIPENYSLAFA
jgi:hypothetical protein